MKKRPVEPYFDGIIALVTAGHTLKSACEAMPGCPSFGRFYTVLKNFPEFNKRLNEARTLSGIRRPGARLGEQAYSAALDRIAVAVEANLDNWSAPGLPLISALRFLARKDLEFGRRFAEAVRKHDELHQRARPYSEQEHRAAFEIVALNFGRPKADVDALLRAEGLPTFETVRDRSKLNENAKRDFEAAWGTRSSRAWDAEDCLTAIRLLASQPTRAARDLENPNLPTTATIVKMAATDAEVRREFAAYQRLRDQVRSMRVGENLRRSLQHDDLYREADKLFHRNHPDRDDMITEVVMAVLEGKLERKDIKTSGAAIGWDFVNRNRDIDTDSLDAPFGGFDGAASLGETISIGEWTFEDAI